MLLRINKSWVQNFPSYESKCSDQNTKVVQFYPWTVAIPYFSGASDWIEMITSVAQCRALNGSGSKSSNIVVSKINAQWQLFDSDYSNCKPVEKNSAINDVTISIYTHMPEGNIDTVPGNINSYTQQLSQHGYDQCAYMYVQRNINTVTFKINLYAHWLSEYGHNRDTYATPSGNINTVSRNINPHAQWVSHYIRPVAILIQSLKL